MANENPAIVVSGIVTITQKGSAGQVLALILEMPNMVISLAVSRGMLAMWPRSEFKSLVCVDGVDGGHPFDRWKSFW